MREKTPTKVAERIMVLLFRKASRWHRINPCGNAYSGEYKNEVYTAIVPALEYIDVLATCMVWQEKIRLVFQSAYH